MEYENLPLAFAVLSFADKHHRTDLNALCAAVGGDLLVLRRLVEQMAEDGLFRIGDGANFQITLTPDGKILYLRIKERVEKDAKAKSDKGKEKRRDRGFQIVLALLSFALGLLAEHFTQLLSLLGL